MIIKYIRFYTICRLLFKWRYICNIDHLCKMFKDISKIPLLTYFWLLLLSSKLIRYRNIFTSAFKYLDPTLNTLIKTNKSFGTTECSSFLKCKNLSSPLLTGHSRHMVSVLYLCTCSWHSRQTNIKLFLKPCCSLLCSALLMVTHSHTPSSWKYCIIVQKK